jgi:multiple sugar transport system ATP-binding protein
MATISLRGVSKAYGEQPPVLHQVDLDIGGSEFCVFLGPSGCGKSTLLRIIAGLEDPTSGEVRINDAIVNDVAPSRRGIAMVFQSYALFPHMTVAENIGFGLKLAKTPKPEIERRVLEAARVLQLETLLDRKPKALSGGQRQRVAIGRAIVRSPGVFLFDEPLSNLDATLRSQTRISIARLHRQFKTVSSVYVTHDQVEAMTLADKIVLLNSGKTAAEAGSIAQVGAPLELYHRPKTRFVASFIGSPQMNFFAATVSAIGSDSVSVRLERDGSQVETWISGQGLSPGQPVTLGIRPEHIQLIDSHHEVPADFSILANVVELVERLGEQTYLHLSGDAEQPFMVKVQGNSQHQAGDPVQMAFPPESCHLFTADGLAVAHVQH